jgi:hypothetical protein
MRCLSLTRVAAVLSLAVLAGCGESDRNETAPVRGTVTLEGKPFTEGGVIVFLPEVQCKMANGRIQTDGTYELSTYSLGDGAAVGKHQVVVQPLPAEELDESGENQPTIKSGIPKKYRTPSTSGLVFEVKSGEVNEFSIDLKANEAN